MRAGQRWLAHVLTIFYVLPVQYHASGPIRPDTPGFTAKHLPSSPGPDFLS